MSEFHEIFRLVVARWAKLMIQPMNTVKLIPQLDLLKGITPKRIQDRQRLLQQLDNAERPGVG